MNRYGDWTIFYYQSVSSTQRVAAELMRAGAPDRVLDHTVIVARSQTAGYGRKGEEWQDEQGSALLSTLILLPDDVQQVAFSTMMAALAVAQATETLSGLRARIKWPNDVLLNGRKYAGILADVSWTGTTLDAVRIGIGVNVGGSREAFIAAGLPSATSITAECGQVLAVESTLEAILDRITDLEAIMTIEGPIGILTRWRDALSTLGEPVIATMLDGSTIHAIAHDVTEDGSLIVVTEAGGPITLRSAAVRSLRSIDH